MKNKKSESKELASAISYMLSSGLNMKEDDHKELVGIVYFMIENDPDNLTKKTTDTIFKRLEELLTKYY